MYKVFVNESLLTFSSPSAENPSPASKTAAPEDTERIVRGLLAGDISDTDYHIPLSGNGTLDYLQAHFEPITAAGGVVLDRQGKILWIFRRGKWDLPKGKADEGETAEQTAVREVREECGIQHLRVIRHLGDTYHIYPINKGKKAVFKTTHWFLMETHDTVFTPQTEEEITEIRFFAPHDPTPLGNTFRNLKVFLDEHYDQKN